MPSRISKITAVLSALYSVTFLASCDSANPALKDPLGANHYYISRLPFVFKDALPEGWSCQDCVYFENVEERPENKGRFSVEFGFECGAHVLCLETYFSSFEDEMAKMKITMTASEYDMPFLGDMYSAYSSLVSESNKTLSDIISEKNIDACYGDEVEAYQVWYGTFGGHDARFSKFFDGSCKFCANGDVKVSLLGAMMS